MRNKGVFGPSHFGHPWLMRRLRRLMHATDGGHEWRQLWLWQRPAWGCCEWREDAWLRGNDDPQKGISPNLASIHATSNMWMSSPCILWLWVPTALAATLGLSSSWRSHIRSPYATPANTAMEPETGYQTDQANETHDEENNKASDSAHR